jgi:DegV family protein with EDD domain
MGGGRIAVVTDSTAYIPEANLGGLKIPVIPLWLIWGDEKFRDGVDIDPAEFYRRLPSSRAFPTTSQPSRGEFEQFFQQAGASADAVVGVFISSKLSATVTNASLAAGDMAGPEVRVVDSLSTSMGLGFAALAAARAASEGKSLDDVVAAAESVRDRAQVIFVPDTLEFLHRGGRIGGAKRLFGTALNIKPLLHLHDGAVEPLASVRTKKRALATLLSTAQERVGNGRIAEAAVIHAACAEAARAVGENVKKRFGLTSISIADMSPVIGAHAGPGTIGLAFHTEG